MNEAEQRVRKLERVGRFLEAVVSGSVQLTADLEAVENQLAGVVEAPYDDLLDLPLRSLTSTRLGRIRRQLEDAQAAWEESKHKRAREVWRDELQKLITRKRMRT